MFYNLKGVYSIGKNKQYKLSYILLFARCLDELVALDRTSWSIKTAYGQKDVLKVEYYDTHKYHTKLHGFPFTSRTDTVGLLSINGRPCQLKQKPRNFEAYLCGSLYSTFTTSFINKFKIDHGKKPPFKQFVHEVLSSTE